MKLPRDVSGAKLLQALEINQRDSATPLRFAQNDEWGVSAL